ncbi:transcriptional regulator [Priestia megaterium]|uniref:helix-turn-helix domain-containing protein n=1 Tax=Priestia megaterium TaxID=1404 RepID=UPI000BF831F5|nr:helix-turn-helix transcriptional regulator [Priestia megaterium]PEZ47034.1 transcriptional regulator [Priestia megaterium]
MKRKRSRTNLGRWLDQHDIEQQELERVTGISKSTIHRLCNDKDHEPRMDVVKRIMKAIKKVDSRVKSEDFWSL